MQKVYLLKTTLGVLCAIFSDKSLIKRSLEISYSKCNAYVVEVSPNLYKVYSREKIGQEPGETELDTFEVFEYWVQDKVDHI